jgi:hypothetical protein
MIFIIFILFIGCGPSIKGIVLYPNGNIVNDRKLTVYSNPWTESDRIINGKFTLNKNIVVMNDYDYTIWVEDSIGNLGMVTGLFPKKRTKIIIVFLRELTAKEAVIETDSIYQILDGAGEKIFRRSE